MRRTTRPFLLALVAAFAVLAAACGNAPESEVAAIEESTEGGDAGGGAQGGTIPIGMLMAITGSGSFYGDVMVPGAQLAADQINAEGGVEGYEFELIVEDHESGSADVAVSAARKLMSVDEVPVILSSFTAPTVAIQPLAQEQGVLVLNGGGVGTDLIGKEGLYNTRMLGAQLMPGLVRWAVEEYDAQRIATIFWNDGAGRGINETVKQTCAEIGCEVVAEEPHEIGATNYGAQLARIAATNPDLLVIGSYGNDVGYIIEQARRQGLDVPIIGNEWTPDAQAIGGDAMEGYVAVIDLFDPETTDDEQAAQFAAAHQEAFGRAPEFYGANYYELVRYVIPELVRRVVAEGGDPTQQGPLLEEMNEAVAEGVAFETVYGEEMTFNDDGTVQKPAGVYRVENGELVRFAGLDDGQVVQTP